MSNFVFGRSLTISAKHLSMRAYCAATSVEHDARRERRLAHAADESCGPGPVASPIAADQRQPFDWTFSSDGLHWDLHFEPSPRDARQWRVFRDGQPKMRPALERPHKR
jgi:hypothetical protein